MQRSIRLIAVLVPLVLGAVASAADEPTQGLRYPSLTPDGKSVVFSYRGDIWIAPRDGKGPAQRLTIHEEQDTLCRVSPDGQQIAFASSRNGNYDIYVMPVTGGEPRQVTFHTAVDILCDWSPDGKRLLITSNRDLGDSELDLYELDLSGGTPRRLTFDGAREASYSPDGLRVVYVRGFNTIYWDNYSGSANYDIYTVDVKGGTPLRLTATDSSERWPFFSRDGRRIWFVTEEKGVANFYAIPAEGGERTQVTKCTDDIHRPCLAWDRKTVAFEMIGRLYVTDLEAPGEKPAPLPLVVRSDLRNSGLELRTITSGGEHVHVSADGRQVAFSLRGDIWTMPANGGEGRQVTSGPEKDEWPRFSPDGTKIAFVSDKTGASDIFVLDVRSGRTTPVTTHRANDFFHAWSPDGKRLVFSSERTGNREIWVVDVDSQQETQLTNHSSADDDPSFSPDGRLIAFDSGRDGAQSIYVMNADGSDVRRVSGGGGFFQVPSFSPDGKMLVFEGMNPTTGNSAGLFVGGVGGGQAMQISEDGSGACWSPVGDYIYFAAERGPESGVYRVAAPKGVWAGERVPFIGRVQVDLKKELENLFDEAWTQLKNGFYDPKMHGVDWEAMRKKYRGWAIDSENKDEFHNVVRQMLAELDASHLGIGGGARTRVVPAVQQTGYLGLDFAQDPEEGGARRVTKVVPKGPADGGGLRVGDIVTRIAGKELKPDSSLDLLLAGTVGKPVQVAYRPRTAAGFEAERTVDLVPLPAGRVSELLHAEWVLTCKRRVEDATKTKDGEVGYIHLDQMNQPNLRRFQETVQQWASNPRIKGMILDVRNNGGGNIHGPLIQILSARPLARVTVRGRDAGIQPDTYWDRPVTLLINERSFSDAEVFPFMFREAKLGKIVGVPTAGGVIGTNDITLSDGSSFRVPRTEFRTMDGRNLEGMGIPPDVLVQETPEDRLMGRDPQLQKAIEVVVAEIAERAKVEPPKPKEEPKPASPSPAPPPVLKADASHPLADARKGEWVRFRVVGDTGEETLIKVTVARVEGAEIFFEKEVEKGQGALPPFPLKMEQKGVLDILPAFGQVLGTTVVQGKVRDSDTDILDARLKWADGAELRLQFTNAVPAYGLYRVEANGQVVVEAIEWGAPPAEEPKTEEAPENPLFDAQVGEWVRVKMTLPRGEFEMTRRVLAVTDDEVTIGVTVHMGGESQEREPQKRPRTRHLAPQDGGAASFGREKRTVAGRDLDCIVMTFTRDGAEEKAWFCPEVPVTGAVRQERGGTVIFEILDWGKD